MKEYIFYLSFVPPSKANKVKINARAFTKSNKRYIVPKDVSLKINKAIWELEIQNEEKNIKFNEPVEVDILFILPTKRRRDLDNIMKTLGDCMTTAGIIEDDNLIHKQTLEKVYIPKKEGVIIKIKKYRKKKTDENLFKQLEEFSESINGSSDNTWK